jgi:predicted nucleotidyltransferase component of viral defense system
MNEAIKKMLAKYSCNTLDEYNLALKEILQKIILLGLYRGKFFEKAAFYGGTALKILYKLDRFSEDLDFSLLSPSKDFSLDHYTEFILKEVRAYGFDAEIELKNKAVKSDIKSAFLKTNTINQLLVIEADQTILKNIPQNQKIKIKIEVDTNPPMKFDTEIKYLLEPIPFYIRAFKLSSMFAGKMHAIMFRKWKNNVKGRDWYDLVWYIKNYPEIDLAHLKERMIQTGDWDADKELTLDTLKTLFIENIDTVNFEQAKKDVKPFVKDLDFLELWSKDFFIAILDKLVEK